MVDKELIARIRRSDERAFYAFCNRHWRSLYLSMLSDTGSKDEAFERVKGLFAECWNRRRRLPGLSTTFAEYVVSNGLDKPEIDHLRGGIIRLFGEKHCFLWLIPMSKKLANFLNVLLGDKHLKYK